MFNFGVLRLKFRQKMPITKKRRMMLNALHPNKGVHNDDGNGN
jgi:hypothetical protein